MTMRDCRIKRPRPTALLAWAGAIISIAAGPACAESQAQADAAAIPGHGSPNTVSFSYTSARLAGVPESFRYQPRERARDAISATATETNGRASAPTGARLRAAHLAASGTEFVDRSAVINRLKELDSLQLIRFWETKDVCLYLGVSEDGFAGLNLTRRNTVSAGRSNDGEDDKAFRARSVAVNQFVELTGERRPTFPAPPSLHAALPGN